MARRTRIEYSTTHITSEAQPRLSSTACSLMVNSPWRRMQWFPPYSACHQTDGQVLGTNLNCSESRQTAAPAGLTPALSPVRVLRSAAWAYPVCRSSTRHRSDCGMHPQWRCLGNRIEYGIAQPRVDSGHGALGCFTVER